MLDTSEKFLRNSLTIRRASEHIWTFPFNYRLLQTATHDNIWLPWCRALFSWWNRRHFQPLQTPSSWSTSFHTRFWVEISRLGQRQWYGGTAYHQQRIITAVLLLRSIYMLISSLPPCETWSQRSHWWKSRGGCDDRSPTYQLACFPSS